jgi:hypothetical protein
VVAADDNDDNNNNTMQCVFNYTLTYARKNQTTNTGMTMYQNQSKQVMKVGLSKNGTNKCELTQLFLMVTRHHNP